MKKIMKLDSSAGVRQIVSDFVIWLRSSLIFHQLETFSSSDEWVIFVHLAAALTIKRFLELKIRSGEKQVCDI